jgi:hypothetical protein
VQERHRVFDEAMLRFNEHLGRIYRCASSTCKHMQWEVAEHKILSKFVAASMPHHCCLR